MLEFYQAYSDYHDLCAERGTLRASGEKEVTGSTVVKYGEDEIDFAKFSASPCVKLYANMPSSAVPHQQSRNWNAWRSASDRGTL